MARISIEEADKYAKSGGSWFSLKDDHDTARIRFMYNDINDVEMDVVHEEEVNGKKRFVNCLRSYDDPIDACPLCARGNKQMLKMFVPVYNEDTKEVQFWQRGKTFASQLASFAGRYNPLVSAVFEVERQGKKGEQTTRYQFYPQGKDDVTMEDLPEVPAVLGGIVMDKTFEELSKGDYGNSPVIERATEVPIARRTPRQSY